MPSQTKKSKKFFKAKLRFKGQKEASTKRLIITLFSKIGFALTNLFKPQLRKS